MDESCEELWRSEGRRTSSPALSLSKQPAWCRGLAGLGQGCSGHTALGRCRAGQRLCWEWERCL